MSHSWNLAFLLTKSERHYKSAISDRVCGNTQQVREAIVTSVPAGELSTHFVYMGIIQVLKIVWLK